MLVEFILYSRSYCHLCEDMQAALEALKPQYDFTVQVEDVDASAELVERYDELVPVLVGKKAGVEVQLCHYFMDEARVRQFLDSDLPDASRM